MRALVGTVCQSSDVAAWAAEKTNATLHYWTAADRTMGVDLHTQYKKLLALVGSGNKQKVVLVQLVSGHMYVHMSRFDDFTANVLNALHAAFKKMQKLGWKADGISFILSSHASMDQYPPRLSHSFPILTSCMRTSGPEVDHGILLPRPYKIWATDRPLSSLGNASHHVWEQKRGVGVFRGALSSFARVLLLQARDLLLRLQQLAP